MTTFKRLMPGWTAAAWNVIKHRLQHIFFSPKRRYCPVCDNFAHAFGHYGNPLRKGVRCNNCGSLERHRFVWLLLTRRTNLFDKPPPSMLHVAPEGCFVNRLKEKLGDKYLTADLLDDDAMVKMDITDIQFSNASFDVIYCSHVLEHVTDDRRAMGEFYRVLKPGGWAVLDVPITAKSTYEDPTITEPQDRLKAFGQEDHVRRYGPDYMERLNEAGFRVEAVSVADLVTGQIAKQMGILPLERRTFICSKQPNLNAGQEHFS